MTDALMRCVATINKTSQYWTDSLMDIGLVPTWVLTGVFTEGTEVFAHFGADCPSGRARDGTRSMDHVPSCPVDGINAFSQSNCLLTYLA